MQSRAYIILRRFRASPPPRRRPPQRSPARPRIFQSWAQITPGNPISPTHGPYGHAAGPRHFLRQRHQCREEYHRDIFAGRHVQLPGFHHQCQRTHGVQSSSGNGQSGGHQRQCYAFVHPGYHQHHQTVHGHRVRPVRCRSFHTADFHLVDHQRRRFNLIKRALHSPSHGRFRYGQSDNRLVLRHGLGQHHDANRANHRQPGLRFTVAGRHLHCAFRARRFHRRRSQPDLHLEPHRHAAGACNLQRKRHQRR